MSRKYYFFFRLFLNAELTLGKPCVNSDIFIFSEKLHIIRIFFSENPNFPFFFGHLLESRFCARLLRTKGFFIFFTVSGQAFPKKTF